jgi:hypothetical protein
MKQAAMITAGDKSNIKPLTCMPRNHRQNVDPVVGLNRLKDDFNNPSNLCLLWRGVNGNFTLTRSRKKKKKNKSKSN